MDALASAAIILWLAVGLIGLILYFASIIWAYKDAEKRGKEGILVALLVALIAWPLSLILWIVIRPDNVIRG